MTIKNYIHNVKISSLLNFMQCYRFKICILIQLRGHAGHISLLRATCLCVIWIHWAEFTKLENFECNEIRMSLHFLFLAFHCVWSQWKKKCSVSVPLHFTNFLLVLQETHPKVVLFCMSTCLYENFIFAWHSKENYIREKKLFELFSSFFPDSVTSNHVKQEPYVPANLRKVVTWVLHHTESCGCFYLAENCCGNRNWMAWFALPIRMFWRPASCVLGLELKPQWYKIPYR